MSSTEVANYGDPETRLRAEIERGLKDNPSYKYALEIGQLFQLKLQFVSESKANEQSQRETAERISSGQPLGDIKPTPLYRMPLPR